MNGCTTTKQALQQTSAQRMTACGTTTQIVRIDGGGYVSKKN